MKSFRWLLPLVALVAFATSSHAGVFVGVSVGLAPPPLPVYVQPVCPGPDLIWTPGYWAYDPDFDDYYWVPGTWVRAPVVGYLWTPGYWGWRDGYYAWHAGYWGPHIGYYGGINYGYGYIGEGYHGGYWNHGTFVYNTAVTNVNTTIIHNTYNKTVVVNRTTVNNVSFNGGKGGATAQPTSQERLAAAEQHVSLTQQQTEHEHGASQNRELRASFNHGRPTIAATSHAAMFTGQGVVGAKGVATSPKNPVTEGNRALGAKPQKSLLSSRASSCKQVGLWLMKQQTHSVRRSRSEGPLPSRGTGGGSRRGCFQRSRINRVGGRLEPWALPAENSSMAIKGRIDCSTRPSLNACCMA